MGSLTLVRRAALGAGVGALALALAAEVAVRCLAPRLGLDPAELARLRALVCDGEVDSFEPRPFVAFARITSAPDINAHGFNDVEWALDRRAGVPRVACLGASTTEGGNEAGRQGAYPTFLRDELEAALGGEVEVLNCGVAAWTTAESLAAWLLTVADHAPDVVVVHHGVNDVEPRLLMGFRPDYAHFRQPWRVPHRNALHRTLTRWSDAYAWYVARLDVPTIKDVVVAPGGGAAAPPAQAPAETAAPFRRNVRSLGRDAVARGASVVLATMPHDPRLDMEDDEETQAWRAGIREHNALLRELCAEEGWTLADLEVLAPELEGSFLDLVHLDPDGNRAKARAVAEAILETGLLAPGG